MKGTSYALLGEVGLRAKLDTVSLIYSNETVSAKFSRPQIEGFVQDALLEVVDSRPPEIVKNATQAVENIQSKLAEPAVEWTVYFPVVNVRVDPSSFQIGDVRFWPSSGVDVLVTRFTQTLGRQDPTSERLIRDTFRDCAVAEVNVNAVDEKKAELIADERVSEVLNGLRLVFSPGYRRNGWYADLKGRIWTGSFDSVRLSSKSAGESFHRTGYSERLPITSHLAAAEIVRKLDRLLSKNAGLRSDLENRLVTGLWSLGRALNQAGDRDAFVGLVTSLEALVLRRTDHRKDPLAIRVALLATDSVDGRKKVYDVMRRLYGIRSEIIHGEQIDVSSSDLALLTSLMQHSFAKALELVPQMISKEDLFEWFKLQRSPRSKAQALRSIVGFLRRLLHP
jgi:hypothetical protein